VNVSRAVVLLLILNFVDAVTTIFWVRNGIASEANGLMAGLLDVGDFPFLLVKLGMGAITALVLLRGADRKLARYGVALALVVYAGAMGSHIFTGLAAFGYFS
jgi:hypothetical protein